MRRTGKALLRLKRLARAGFAMLLCAFALTGWAVSQAANPDLLRQIIAQKAAEAAAATRIGHPGSMFPNSATPDPGTAGSPSGGASAASGTAGAQGGTTPAGGGIGSFYGGGGVDAGAQAGAPAASNRPGYALLHGVAQGSSLADENTTPVGLSQPPVLRPGPPVGLQVMDEGSAGHPVSASQPATVTYTRGLLYIHAENSSLHDILRQISQLTGMVIRGSLPEERVFGDQGPASTAGVLATLLDGTSSNRFLLQDRRARVTELILTPRSGAAITAIDSNNPLDASGRGVEIAGATFR